MKAHPIDALRVALSGVTGRMGQALLAHMAQAEQRYAVVQGLGRAQARATYVYEQAVLPVLGHFHPEIPTDLILEFSHPDHVPSMLDIAMQHKIPILVGTTGLCAETLALCQQAAEQTPVLLAPNTSLGVYVLRHLLKSMPKSLLEHCDIHIHETHHRYKKDSPSGTSYRLHEVLNEVLEQDIPIEMIGHHTQKTQPISHSSARLGRHVGSHEVHLALEHEEITLSHRAYARSAFAQGALFAGRWLVEQAPGLYSMEDVFA